jgi:hypothetical protein
LAQEPAQDELHQVGNAEAEDVYNYAKHAIPHNEMLNRLARNHHLRIQTLEKDVAEFKDALAELRAYPSRQQKRRLFRR